MGGMTEDEAIENLARITNTSYYYVKENFEKLKNTSLNYKKLEDLNIKEEKNEQIPGLHPEGVRIKGN